MKSSIPQTGQKGFSLTELLFVMLIIVGLTAMVAGTFGPIKNQVARHRAKALLQMIDTGLSQYRAEHGGYPICEQLDEGSTILYKSLFGDYNQNGIPDSDRDDLNEGDIKTFLRELQPTVKDEQTGQLTRNKGRTVEKINGEFHVVDPWNNPVYYMNYREGHADAPEGGGKHNPTYDLWSVANDDTLNKEERWIKNW